MKSIRKICIAVFVLVSFCGVTYADNFEIKLSSGDAFEVQDSSGTSLMDVLSNGNVGIGTTAPTKKLDVNGDIYVDGNIEIHDGYMFFYRSGIREGHVTAESDGIAIKAFDTDNGYIKLYGNVYAQYNVGIGTTSPLGKLDVNGSIYQRGSSLHADYVFEADYNLESIKNHADFMWKNKHLKAIPKAKVGENGIEIVEVGSHRKGIVEELEKAHIYISQLEERLAKVEALLNAAQ